MKKKKLIMIPLAVLCMSSLFSCRDNSDISSKNDISESGVSTSESSSGSKAESSRGSKPESTSGSKAEHIIVDGKCSVCGYKKATDGIEYILSSDIHMLL